MVPRFLFELSFNTLSVIFMEYTLMLLLYYSVKLGVLNMLYPQAVFFLSGVNLYLMILRWMNMVIIIFYCLQNFYLCSPSWLLTAVE